MARCSALQNDSSRLLQRELLDGDQSRLDWLIEHLFKQPFNLMTDMLEEIGQPGDGRATALYLCALTMGYYSFAPVLEKMAGDTFNDDPDAFGRDIAARMTLNRDSSAAKEIVQ